MTDARRPYHLAIYLGLSAGAYAGVLAAVTGLQSASEAAVNAARQPSQAAIEALGEGHDRLEAAIRSAMGAYESSAAGYESLAAGVADLDSSLGALQAEVADIQGTARALPDRAPIPVVTRVVRTVRTAPPPVHATTGASGG